jgi:competence protein ComEC
MERWLLTFFIGAILSLFLPIVPDISQIYICFYFAVIFCLIKRLRIYSGLFLGCAWVLSAGFAYQNIWQVNDIEPSAFFGKTITVKGVIANIPKTLSQKTKNEEIIKNVSRFNFIVE